jgi:hypothetical protein
MLGGFCLERIRRPAIRELPCSRVRQRRLAGGVTGLEESLWPFALQQNVSAGRAGGTATSGKIAGSNGSNGPEPSVYEPYNSHPRK